MLKMYLKGNCYSNNNTGGRAKWVSNIFLSQDIVNGSRTNNDWRGTFLLS